MGSRGRSIRLRIYFLVAIPLVTMLGLFGYVAYTSVTNWMNLDRAPNLIRATSEPLTAYVRLLQNERRAAVVYLSQPTTASRTAYQAAVTAAKHGEATLTAALRSPASTDNATTAETTAINAMLADVAGMTGLRGSVTARHLSPLAAFTEYTKIITAQDAVFQAEADSMTNTVAASQGLGLIATVSARENLSEQDALLAGALAAHTLTGPERAAFTQAADRQRGDTLLYESLLSAPELKIFTTTMDAQVPPQLRKSLTRIQQDVESGLPVTALELTGLSPATWQQLTATWQRANYNAGTSAANATLAVDERLAANAKKRVGETAAAGAAGLILTLIVTILLGRSINRRLTALRRTALALATEQLPSVVSRLRRGEPVDVAAEAPPLRAGNDEIGQVGQAIDAVRQTAIRSAVEEARVRQGVNDMFRNLARRNQSLLQRQLSMLDDMERRVTDPEALDDLFKMDHLTTRMRRHAEGLIILSGATPGRSWSAPVKLIDVMRGAIAEVEDYARVRVSTQSQAALVGSAVTDVIHLLAELIENATTLSPPSAQVQVAGERVGNGFAIEIEDRGLGMGPQRLAELNERLANPPEINPANTEQLGLFVVGQLARRHGISVTLRPSPYGGTCAVALIPTELIVAEVPAGTVPGAAGPRAGSSGAVRMPAAPTVGNDWSAANGHRPVPADRVAGNGGAYPPPSGYASPPGHRPPPASRPRKTVLSETVPIDAVPIDAVPIDAVPINTVPINTVPINTVPINTVPGSDPRRGGRPGADDEVPVVTDVPAGRPTGPQPSSFDVFTPLRRSRPEAPATAVPVDEASGQSYPDSGGPVPGTAPGTSGQDAISHGGSHRRSGPRHNGPGDNGAGDAGYPPAGSADESSTDESSTDESSTDESSTDGSRDSAGDDDYTGLPRRVRQANLAPELRASVAGVNGPAVPQATAASLTVMRNTLSAMQRGWKQDRSQAQRETEDGAGED